MKTKGEVNFKCQCLEERKIEVPKLALFKCAFINVICEGCESEWELKFKNHPKLEKGQVSIQTKLTLMSEQLKALLAEEKEFEAKENVAP